MAIGVDPVTGEIIHTGEAPPLSKIPPEVSMDAGIKAQERALVELGCQGMQPKNAVQLPPGTDSAY